MKARSECRKKKSNFIKHFTEINQSQLTDQQKLHCKNEIKNIQLHVVRQVSGRKLYARDDILGPIHATLRGRSLYSSPSRSKGSNKEERERGG